MSASSRKRAPDSDDLEDEFLNGAIRKVVLHNFVTYSDVEFIPGPGLNLVIGPNGSGKSSIVCALCLGLGGNPSSLGRADKIGDFVKRGFEAAYCEITLHDASAPNNRTVIRRTFTKDNESTWIVNGRKNTRKHVIELTTALNVQVDNLCQFLAQEKVGEFARLEPKGLLKDTEKAAGKGELYDQHLRLIELRKNEKEARQDMESSSAELERKLKQADVLANDVDRLRDRQALQNKIGLLKKKVPWIKFKELKEKAKQINKEYVAAKIVLDELKTTQEPIRVFVQGLSSQTKALTSESGRLRGEAKKFDQKYAQLKDQCDAFEVTFQGLEEELSAVDKRATDVQHEVAATEEKVALLREKLEALPDPADIQAQLRTAHEDKDALNNTITSVNGNIHDLADRIQDLQREKNAHLSQLKSLQSERERRSITLFKNKMGHGVSHEGQNCKRFLNWLDSEGRSKCSGKVYGPIGLEIQCSIRGAEGFLEHAIPWRSMFGFVVENDEDWTILSNARSTLNVRVNISTTSTIQFSHKCSLSNGFSWLDDAVSGPEPVLQYLRALFGLADVAWTSQSNVVPQSVMRVDHTDRSRPSRLFFGNQYANQSFSRYGARKQVFGIEKIRPAYLLSENVDNSLLSGLTEKVASIDSKIASLAAEKEELQQSLVPLARKVKGLTSICGDLLSKEKQRKSWTRTVEEHLRNITKLSKTADIEGDKQRVRDSISKLNAKRVKTLASVSYAIRDFVTGLEASSAASIAAAHSAELLRMTKTSLKKQSMAHASAEQNAQTLKSSLVSAAKIAKNQKIVAENKAPLAQYEELFNEEWMPDTIEDVDRMSITIQAQIDAVVGDDSAIARHHALLQEIKSLQRKQQAYSEKHEEQLAEINSIKQHWLPKLTEVTSRISRTYSKFFAEFNCGGEVQLLTGDDEAEFGISVRVRFRGGELQQLNQSRQSGGERSVATMLYLLALQTVTNCPFRVVDEINQGMDPVNEKNIFNQLVKCSSGRGNPQIFCFTPKLLPNLEFTPAITTLVVFNGPWNLPQSEFNLPEIVAKRARV